MVVPLPAGNAGDTNARQLAKAVETVVDKRVEIVNRPGAAQATGIESLIGAEPDGYTVAMVSTPAYAALTKNSDKWRAVAVLASANQALFVPAKSESQSLEELLAAADKGQAKVGMTSLQGVAGLNVTKLAEESGTKVDRVAFSGAQDLIRALLAGTADAAAGGQTEYLSLIESGQVRPLVVFASQRDPAMPDVPTVTEAGYGDGYFPVDYFIIVPKDTPDDVVTRLQEAFKAASETPSYREFLQKNSFQATFKPASEASSYLAEQLAGLAAEAKRSK